MIRDRILWLTETIYPSIVLFIVSSGVTFVLRKSAEVSTNGGHDLLAPIGEILNPWILYTVWCFAGLVFVGYLLRRSFCN